MQSYVSLSQSIGRVMSGGTRIIHTLLKNTGTDVQCIDQDTSVGDKGGAGIEEKKWFVNRCVLDFCSRGSKSGY